MSDRATPSTGSQYDEFADVYADGGPYNQLYERPAMLELLGDLKGLNVLDVGCGSGVMTESLVRAGASVIGIDGREGMLRRARKRLGPEVELRLHDLHDPLPWLDTDSIDLVAASLVMHYLT